MGEFLSEYNSLNNISIGLHVLYNHLILKDCYEVGLIPEDTWKTYLMDELNVMIKKGQEGNDGE